MKTNIIILIVLICCAIFIPQLIVKHMKKDNSYGPITWQALRDIRTEMQTLQDYLEVSCAWFTDVNIGEDAKYICEDACRARFPKSFDRMPILYHGGDPCEDK